MRTEEQSPIRVACERRNRDLDPQLVWRGKDAQDRSNLIVLAPPLYIQEKVHPKALIGDLRWRSRSGHEQRQIAIEGFIQDHLGMGDEDDLQAVRMVHEFE